MFLLFKSKTRYIGKSNIIDIVNDLKNNVKGFAIKVPKNYNIKKLRKLTKKFKGFVFNIRNYKLIILKNI